MFDLTRSFFNDEREYPVAAGAVIAEEGSLLVQVTDTLGGVAVQPCTTGAGQRLAGFAICDAMKVTTETVVEQITVPVAGGSVSLHNQNLIVATAYATANLVPLANAGVGPGDPGTGNYYLTTTGVITFNVAQHGQTVVIQYRYNLTLEQLENKYHERSISNRGQDYFSSCAVGCLDGVIYTSMYSTAVAYTILGSVYPAAGGTVSSAAGGAAFAVGYVVQLPSVNDGLLGVKFTLPIVS